MSIATRHAVPAALAVLAAALLAAPLTATRADAATVAPATRISTTPREFASTDGDILAITKVAGAATPRIAIGGNFRHVVTPDGVRHPALNLAILDEATGAVLYAGNADSYVRAITSYRGVTYVGGDFTTFGGVTRSRAAAVSAAGAVTPWNPAPRSRVRAMTADSTGVYLGGDLGVTRKVALTTGRVLWSKVTAGGPVRSMLLSGGALYVGGLFETYDRTTRHGLVKVRTATGAILPAFNARLRADSGAGPRGAYDGEGVISLSPGPTSATIGVGVGGHAPPRHASNEVILANATTGARVWRVGLVADCQALSLVGRTFVAGYHRMSPNTTVPYPHFAAQLQASNGALIPWDPAVTGEQSNADGGNNGVQASYADPATRTLFLAGAFTRWRGVRGHQSLVAFTWS